MVARLVPFPLFPSKNCSHQVLVVSLVVEEFADIIEDPTPLLSQPLPPPIAHRHAPPQPILNPSTNNEIIANHISSSLFNFTSIDLPGHGDTQQHNPMSTTDPSINDSWDIVGEGVASAMSERLEHEEVQNALEEKTHVVFGCGLSMGATSFLYANSILPNTLDGLLFMEPIIPSSFVGAGGANTLAQASKKRRSVQIFLFVLSLTSLSCSDCPNFIDFFFPTRDRRILQVQASISRLG